MSYMLISHGPSPPLRMGLWGDILCHLPADRNQLMPRKKAPVSASSISAGASQVDRPFLRDDPGRLPAIFHPRKLTPFCAVLLCELSKSSSGRGFSADKFMNTLIIFTETRSHW